MDMFALWLLIAVAVGLGWVIGHHQRLAFSEEGASGKKGGSEHPLALGYLFEAFDSPAVDSFVEQLEIDERTAPLYLAVANYYRRQGDLERSTLIHQKLLGESSIQDKLASQVTFELAQDYMAAGLYDRAESVLTGLLADSDWHERSLLGLLEIYERERDWVVAREKALSLGSRKNKRISKRAAQYCCELAEAELRKSKRTNARDLAKEALSIDKACVRASLLLAKVEVETGNFQIALNVLKQVEQQDPSYVVESLDLAQECCTQLDQREKFRRILDYVWERQPSSKVLIKSAEVIAQLESTREATEYLQSKLDEFPSLTGLKVLIELLIPVAEPEPKRWIRVVKGVMENIIHQEPTYRCENCGFAGHTLHWQCPSCRQWAAVKPLLWT